MKITSIFTVLVIVLSNCKGGVLIPVFGGYAEFDLENAEDSVFVKEYWNNDLLQGEGHYLLDKYRNPTIQKVGHWVSFHENGQLKSTGKYRAGSYTDCCTPGPCDQHYYYKFGEWKYYYSNGQIKATGVYTEKKLHIETNCLGGDDFPFGLTYEDWKYYSFDGELIRPTLLQIREYEIILNDDYHTYGNYFWAPDSTRKNIEIIKIE